MKKEKNVANPQNPFADFEDDFKKAEKAENVTPGRIPPETYKFVLTSQEVPANSGTMADFEVIIGKNTGTKGFKIFCEVLEPESVKNPNTGEPHVTKGTVLDHVWWVSTKTLPFIKRDVSTISGREIESLGELLKIAWAGRTFEGVVGDEEYQGRISSRIKFINPWSPKAEEGANPHGVATVGKETAKVDPKKVDAKKADPTPAKGAAGGAAGVPVKGAAASASPKAGAAGGTADSW